MAESWTFFGLTVWKYGLCAAVGALCYLALARVTMRGLPTKAAAIFGPLAVALGVVCARLAYGLTEIAYFTETIEQPEKLLCFWDGGFSMTGLLLGLLLAAWLAGRLGKAPIGRMLDGAMLPAGLLIAVLRMGEGYTSLGVGRYFDAGGLTAAAPWLFVASGLGNATLYSLAVYRIEALIALLILAVSALWGRGAKPGDRALFTLALYGACQLVLESLRDDGHMLWGFVRAQQAYAAAMPLTALIVWGARRKAGKVRATVAWMLIPISLLLIVMTVRPLNHVLDLSGHPLLGWGGAALWAADLGRYRRPGRTPPPGARGWGGGRG